MDWESGNRRPKSNQQPLNPAAMNLAEGAIRGLRFPVDKDDMLWTPGVLLVSPTGPTGLVGVAAVGQPADPSARPSGVSSNAQVWVYGSDGLLHLVKTPGALDGALTYLSDSAMAVGAVRPIYRNLSALQNIALAAGVQFRSLSAVATAQDIVIDLRQLHSTLAIVMTCSAGTATFDLAASADDVNWIAIDSIAAAAATAKQYDNTHLGTTTAVNPLAFRWLHLVIGSAGAGNTTDLSVGAK